MPPPPAQLTSARSGASAQAASTASITSASLVMSAWTYTAPSSSATCLPGSSLTSMMTTRSPSPASRRAVASPSPDAPPVTIAEDPARSIVLPSPSVVRLVHVLEVEQGPRVELDDLPHLVVGHVREHLRRALPSVRPVRVRVRIVHLERDAVDADQFARPHTVLVVDEASPEVLAEQVRRASLLVDVLVPAVAVPGVVGPFEDVRNPADAAFGEDDLEAGVTVENRREEHVDRRAHEVRAVHRDLDRERGIGGKTWHLAGGPEVQAERQVGVLAGREDLVPVVRVEGRQSQGSRVLREGDAAGALGGNALDLLDAQLRIPDRQHRQRDEAVGRGT